jgi:hypothetical protein
MFFVSPSVSRFNHIEAEAKVRLKACDLLHEENMLYFWWACLKQNYAAANHSTAYFFLASCTHLSVDGVDNFTCYFMHTSLPLAFSLNSLRLLVTLVSVDIAFCCE